MPGRDIVVVGASAGGIEALRAPVGGLPEDFPGSVFVVMHTAPDSPGVLAQILDRPGPLPAANATNREHIRPGHIYVAPPDLHMLLEPGRVRLTRGPKENRFRCHTGHAFSADSLLSQLTESVEETLWSAIRSIDESAMLMRHMAEHLGETGGGTPERFLDKARDAERRSALVRRAVFGHEHLSEEKVSADAEAGQ